MENFRALRERLENFSFEGNDVEKLSKKFQELAPFFLYGGYIRVLNRYRIYIQRVEFYFHSELNDGIKDPIVYHRNEHHVAGILPYYKPLTFHAHASGFDIAFENPKKEYRASALIRGYEIYDEAEDKKEFMVFVHKYEKVRDIKKNKDVQVDKGRFEYANDVESVVNTQSTYLYDILNGFGDAGTISWVDEPLPQIDSYNPQKHRSKRQGVYTGAKWQDDDKQSFRNEREREWAFYRDKLEKSDIH